MKETYTYDDLFGILLYKNKDDTERRYFIIECEYWFLYRWRFSHGWNLKKKKRCERNGFKGFEVTIRTNR